MDLKTAAESSFENCSREEMIEFCDQLGVKYHPQNSAKNLRKLLLSQLGTYTEVEAEPEPEEQALDSSGLEMAELANLNLRAQGSWQGRRRLITLHRAMEHESTFPQFFGWGGLHCYVPFGGGPHAVPYPIWNILLASQEGKRMERKRQTDSDGRIFFVETWLSSHRFMFSDHGDDPETAHLPCDLLEQTRWMWQKSHGFDQYSVAQIKTICNRLRINVPEDWKKDDMKTAIRSLIGLSTTDSLGAPAAGIPRRSAA
jgi:hypothetical protein